VSTWLYVRGKLEPTRVRITQQVWTSPVKLGEAFFVPGHGNLRGDAATPVKVLVIRGLRLNVFLANYGLATKRRVRVTLTIAQRPRPIVRSLTIAAMKPWDPNETFLRFPHLDGVRPGKTTVVLRVELPGAPPMRYPVAFTRP
jgi:hypothetical protein